MKRILILATVLSVAFLGALFSFVDASAFSPYHCTTSLNTSTESPSPNLSMNGAGNVSGGVHFAVDCNGTVGWPCQVCATFTYSYQPTATSGWVALGGVDCAGPDNPVKCQNLNQDVTMVGPARDLPVSFGNWYKVNIVVYPVYCDQLETYGGEPLWSGSCSATLGG